MKIEQGFLAGAIIAVLGGLTAVVLVAPKPKPLPYAPESDGVSGPDIFTTKKHVKEEFGPETQDTQFFPTHGTPDKTPFFMSYNFYPEGTLSNLLQQRPVCSKEKYGPEPSVYFSFDNRIAKAN